MRKLGFAEMNAFVAIADPSRRQLIELLRRGERPVSELADEFKMTRPAISQHLKLLHDAGVVRERRDGRQRLYRLHAAGLREVAAWINRYEKFWNERLKRLGDYLNTEDSDVGH